jgi:hypothetical protein
MTEPDWRGKLHLRDGETLRHEESKVEGFMQETDVDTYSIVNGAGSVTGTVRVTDHTAVKGFKRTVRVVQKDANGRVVLEFVD